MNFCENLPVCAHNIEIRNSRVTVSNTAFSCIYVVNKNREVQQQRTSNELNNFLLCKEESCTMEPGRWALNFSFRRSGSWVVS